MEFHAAILWVSAGDNTVYGCDDGGVQPCATVRVWLSVMEAGVSYSATLPVPAYDCAVLCRGTDGLRLRL